MALATLAVIVALAGLAVATLFFVALEPWSRTAALLLPVCAVVALTVGVGRLADGWERRFWTEIAGAAVLWGLARAVLVMADPRTVTPAVAAGALFAAAFVAFLAAVERPARRRGQAGQPGSGAWEGAGGTVFVLGLFFYFVVIPAAVDPAVDAVYRQLFSMVLVLDLYATGKLVHRGLATGATRWRMLYSLLVLMAVGVFLNDVLAFWRLAGVVPNIGSDAYGLIGSVPLVFLVLAARLRHHPFPSAEALADSAGRDASPRPPEQLVALALAFPFIHLFLYAGGLLGTAGESLRDAFMLIWLLIFGALALGQQRHLGNRVRHLGLESRRAEETLRRQQESRDQELHDSRAMLRISEEKLSKAWRSIPDAMLISTVAEGRLLEVNDSFLRHFGYDRDEVLGKTGVELKLWVEPEDRAMMTRLLRERGAVRNLAFELTRKSGEKRLTLLSGEIVDLEGMTCFVMVLRDVTELKSLDFAAH